MNNCKSKAPFFTIGSLDNCRIGLGDCCKCGDLTGDPRFLAWNPEENAVCCNLAVS